MGAKLRAEEIDKNILRVRVTRAGMWFIAVMLDTFL